MTRRLTVAERLASAEKDVLLADIATQSSWDRFIVEQAVFHFGQIRDEWSCNDIRGELPEIGRGFLGAAINSLRMGGIIARRNERVASTSKDTHGHGIHVWHLTARGRAIAAERTARTQQRRAA
ncbi:hypothetical protein ACWEAF_26335 [Streptomyces sp. NPDC005071]